MRVPFMRGKLVLCWTLRFENRSRLRSSWHSNRILCWCPYENCVQYRNVQRASNRPMIPSLPRCCSWRGRFYLRPRAGKGVSTKRSRPRWAIDDSTIYRRCYCCIGKRPGVSNRCSIAVACSLWLGAFHSCVAAYVRTLICGWTYHTNMSLSWQRAQE